MVCTAFQSWQTYNAWNVFNLVRLVIRPEECLSAREDIAGMAQFLRVESKAEALDTLFGASHSSPATSIRVYLTAFVFFMTRGRVSLLQLAVDCGKGDL